MVTIPPPPVAGDDRRSVSVPNRAHAFHGVAGGSARPGHFGHHFAPTCFDIAPVRRRRLPIQRSESSSASPTPPSASSGSSSRSPRSDQGRLSSSPTTSISLSTSPYPSSQHTNSPQSGAGTPSWSASSGSIALASFGKRSASASGSNAPAQPVLRSGVDLTSHYRNYVRALNTRTFDLICRYVAARVTHNGVTMGHAEFCSLIPPGAVFMPEDIIVDFTNRTIAARLYVEYPCTTGCTTLWGVAPFAADGEEERGRTECRRKICQVDEMAFYRFDEEWRIESVNVMVASRNPIRSGSGSDDDYRERARSGSM
ncbi:hypothetical protein A1Q2_00582 [Trichosporon asahii var. asahii CBS 8904]|uniref:SnoaL-like domain-containing protein n=1 Tax=Trichosporon asahii var. asahii (strain CBS 8904) TaxID=1220162 RepID=K1VX85_TRIAC|nr:hypothetical protein A1Q2_00582 [Trichosporon asahii var. asahii CBS 8904]